MITSLPNVVGLNCTVVVQFVPVELVLFVFVQSAHIVPELPSQFDSQWNVWLVAPPRMSMRMDDVVLGLPSA
jgi:hypothetical protein